MLTRTQLDILKKLSESEEGEIVCEGHICYIDTDTLSKADVYALIAVMALSGVSDEGSDLERYSLNSTGKLLLANPEYEHQIVQALDIGRLSGFAIQNRTNKPV